MTLNAGSEDTSMTHLGSMAVRPRRETRRGQKTGGPVTAADREPFARSIERLVSRPARSRGLSARMRLQLRIDVRVAIADQAAELDEARNTACASFEASTVSRILWLMRQPRAARRFVGDGFQHRRRTRDIAAVRR